MTIPNNPIVNAGLLYVNGLQIVNTPSNTPVPTILMLNGAARDSTNTSDIILSNTITLDITKVGANGLDIGTAIQNAFYAVYVIGDSTDNNPTAGLFSLAPASDTDTLPTPHLPLGYDMYRRVGWILTQAGIVISSFAQSGVGQSRTYYYFGPINVLTGGSSTTYVSVDLFTCVPPIAQPELSAINEVLLNVNYTPSSATHYVEFNDFSINGVFSNGIVQFGGGVAALQFGSVRVPSRRQKIFYRVASGDALTLSVTGYTDYLS
jgi:hypothetical protein